ncbi:MAG: hypothetical protein U0002_19550 [Thermoanaerobaculia bacterium]
MFGLLWKVFLAGAVGGLVNALLSDNGFVFPKKVEGTGIYQPGGLTNVLLGGVAAALSWGFYGPLAGYLIDGTKAALEKGGPPAEAIGITLSALASAVLVGVGGARWLTNEVDKRLLRSANVELAQTQPQAGAAGQLATATPAQAVSVARGLPH